MGVAQKVTSLRLCFLVHANKMTGFGHIFRSLALARTAQERGHSVTIVGDRQPANLPWLHAPYNSQPALASALEVLNPDWLIVDVPDPLPGWIRETAKCQILTLNGIGYNQSDGSNLRVIQGVADIKLPGPQDKVPVLKGIEYVILRPEIAKYQCQIKGQETLVWGGGANVLNLHQRFFSACPGRFAVHIISEMITPPILNTPTQTYLRMKAESDDFFAWLAGSKDVVAAMGVIAWESAFYRLPIRVFSASPLHLVFAQGMERAGLLKAYPKVGMPETNEELRAFLDEPFEPTGRPPDTKGAERIIQAIEKS